MIAVIFGIQGVGKSSVVKGVMSKFVGDKTFRLLQWGEKTYEIALQKKIIRIGDYRKESNLDAIYEDIEMGTTIVKDGENKHYIFVSEEKYLANARDEIRHLDLNTQKMLQKEVTNYIASEVQGNPNSNYLVETHAALKTLQGYLPGLTLDFMQKVKPDIYIIIEANPDDLFVRRIRDKERKREHDKTTKDISINLDTTRYFASTYATYTHSPLFIIENKDKLVDDTVEAIADVLKRFEK